MIRSVVPFRHWHYAWLGPSAERSIALPQLQSALEQIEKQNSWTLTVDGEPIVCAGTIQQWSGRHTAWAYFARGVVRHLPWITEQTLDNLNGVQGRVECTVREDFAAGHRWVLNLGFKVETPALRGYGPEGETHVGYVRFA